MCDACDGCHLIFTHGAIAFMNKLDEEVAELRLLHAAKPTRVQKKSLSSDWEGDPMS